jgi:hypothetical protein
MAEQRNIIGVNPLDYENIAAELAPVENARLGRIVLPEDAEQDTALRACNLVGASDEDDKALAEYIRQLDNEFAAAAIENTPIAQILPQEEPDTLVYFGPGWDMKALGLTRHKHLTRHLYIDALPGLAHYTIGSPAHDKTKDVTSLINAIMCSLRRYKPTGHPTQEGNRLTFSLKDGRIVEYWINTTVADALKNSYIAHRLRNAAHLHTKGFEPREYGLIPSRDMPRSTH